MSQAQMSGPRSPRQGEWQPNRIPKLSYRKAIPQDELEKINYPPREPVVQSAPIVRTSSVRDTSANVDFSTSAVMPNSAKKKNSSFLSGFFSKEPTISALAQVEADLTAKHGAANPQAVPHVSSRKMPEYVPKVNSRWDGIPETVRNREREDKQRKRLSQRSSVIPPHHLLRSQSSDGSLRANLSTQRSGSRRESDTASHTDSWQSKNDNLPNFPRSGSFSSASSSTDSREAEARQVASAKAQSFRSPSGSSLPEITAFFPHQKQASTRVVEKEYHSSPIDVIPEHSSSPISTPREMSPATPVYSTGKDVSPRVVATDTDSAGGYAATRSLKRTKHVPIDAFLAGEARPLELDDDDDDSVSMPTSIPLLGRAKQDQGGVVNAKIVSKPHSSRGRLDGRANTVVRSEAAPWEDQVPTKIGPSPARNRPAKSLAKSK